MKKRIPGNLTTPDLVILALLAERPMHGYEINRELDRRDASDWVEISRPQVYYSLEKLLKNQVIAPATDGELPQGPDRQKYKITPRGRVQFLAALDDTKWVRNRPPTPFQTWLALTPNLSKASVLRLLEERIEYLGAQLEKERNTLKAILAEKGAMSAVAAKMVQLCILQFEVELKWLKQITTDPEWLRAGLRCP